MLCRSCVHSIACTYVCIAAGCFSFAVYSYVGTEVTVHSAVSSCLRVVNNCHCSCILCEWLHHLSKVNNSQSC